MKDNAYYREYYAKHKEHKKSLVRKYRASLPPVVYRWVDEDGEVVYVGRGSKIRAREHRFRSPWWKSSYTLYMETCENEWESMMLEAMWGMTFLPKYNRDGYRHNGKLSK